MRRDPLHLGLGSEGPFPSEQLIGKHAKGVDVPGKLIDSVEGEFIDLELLAWKYHYCSIFLLDNCRSGYVHAALQHIAVIDTRLTIVVDVAKIYLPRRFLRGFDRLCGGRILRRRNAQS